MTSEPLFEPTTFDKAFPNIKSIRVEVVQHGDYFPEERLRTSIYKTGRRRFTVPCGNPRCKQGGFKIHDQILFMDQSKETEKTWEDVWCPGHEGSSKGGRKGNPCDNRATITIRIEYKQTK